MLTLTFCLNISKCFFVYLELFQDETLVFGKASLVKLEIFLLVFNLM